MKEFTLTQTYRRVVKAVEPYIEDSRFTINISTTPKYFQVRSVGSINYWYITVYISEWNNGTPGNSINIYIRNNKELKEFKSKLKEFMKNYGYEETNGNIK